MLIRFIRGVRALITVLLGGCVCRPELATGGDHASWCPAFAVECTCYEMFGTGHMPGCPAGAEMRRDLEIAQIDRALPGAGRQIRRREAIRRRHRRLRCAWAAGTERRR